MPPPGQHPDQPESRAHVPHPASPFAEIPHRQAHKPVATRFELHPLQQLACATLVLDACCRKPAQVLHAAGQPVAQPLQLRQRQQTRTGRGFGPDLGKLRRGDVRERIGHDRRAFALEPADLPSQGVANVTLVDLRRTAAGDRDISFDGDIPSVSDLCCESVTIYDKPGLAHTVSSR